MAEMRDSLIAYLEITARPVGNANQMTAVARHFGATMDIDPAWMEPTIDWVMLSRRVRERILPESSLLAMTEPALFHVGNILALAVPLLSELNARSQLGFLIHTLMALAHLQGDILLTDGARLRGAVTRGEVHAAPGLLLGPGALAAQHQAQRARVPRILVDPALLRATPYDPLLRGGRPGVSVPVSAFRDLLLTQDSDGLWFVHYLNVMAADPFASERLNAHARSIERVLAHLGELNDDALDWMWLASYHDRTVEKIPALDEQSRAALRIQTDSPLWFRF